MNVNIDDIEKKIGCEFNNKELLLRAFTHSSFTNEHPGAQSYERLEFLGDATLGFVTGLYLYETFPSYREGKLSKLRAGIVDRNTIAGIVDDLDIMKYIRAGAGNACDNLMCSVKAKCDLFEAIIGALVIDNDRDLRVAGDFILRFLKSKVNSVHADYKSKLFEKCARDGTKPEFTVLEKANDGNRAHFKVALSVNGERKTIGEGSNTKEAEQEACKKFLESP